MLSKYINGKRKKIVATTLAVTFAFSSPLALIPPVNTDAMENKTTNTEVSTTQTEVETAKAEVDAAETKYMDTWYIYKDAEAALDEACVIGTDEEIAKAENYLSYDIKIKMMDKASRALNAALKKYNAILGIEYTEESQYSVLSLEYAENAFRKTVLGAEYLDKVKVAEAEFEAKLDAAEAEFKKIYSNEIYKVAWAEYSAKIEAADDELEQGIISDTEYEAKIEAADDEFETKLSNYGFDSIEKIAKSEREAKTDAAYDEFYATRHAAWAEYKAKCAEAKEAAKTAQIGLYSAKDELSGIASKLAEAAANGDEDGMRRYVAEMNETNTEIQLADAAEDLIDAIASGNEENISTAVANVNDAAKAEDEADEALDEVKQEKTWAAKMDIVRAKKNEAQTKVKEAQTKKDEAQTKVNAAEFMSAEYYAAKAEYYTAAAEWDAAQVEYYAAAAEWDTANDSDNSFSKRQEASYKQSEAEHKQLAEAALAKYNAKIGT